MARGWESKSVEEQIESAELHRTKQDSLHKSAEEVVREQKCASIQLQRTRVLRELEAATHPRRREQLQAALSYLDQELEACSRRM